MTPTIGRSHGIHAEPVTFGLKLAYAYAEFSRARERLLAARKEVATCAISGAVGTFAQIDPRVEEHVAKAMGLTPEPISTQVIPRDRHAMYFATLGVIASSVERLATEIRHLQRTEVLEAEEFFSEGQKGSSAMPHKRNPVLSENLTGLARMVRAYAMPAMENVVLWHERDISHSSASASPDRPRAASQSAGRCSRSACAARGRRSWNPTAASSSPRRWCPSPSASWPFPDRLPPARPCPRPSSAISTVVVVNRARIRDPDQTEIGQQA